MIRLRSGGDKQKWNKIRMEKKKIKIAVKQFWFVEVKPVDDLFYTLVCLKLAFQTNFKMVSFIVCFRK